MSRQSGILISSVAALHAALTPVSAQESNHSNATTLFCTVNRVDPLNPAKRVGEDSINMSLQSLVQEIENALPADSHSVGKPTTYLAVSNLNKRVALIRGTIRDVPSPLRNYAYVREAEQVLLENLHNAESRSHECTTQPQADANLFLKGYTATNTVINEGGIVHYDNAHEAPLVAESRPFEPKVAATNKDQKDTDGLFTAAPYAQTASGQREHTVAFWNQTAHDPARRSDR